MKKINNARAIKNAHKKTYPPLVEVLENGTKVKSKPANYVPLRTFAKKHPLGTTWLAGKARA